MEAGFFEGEDEGAVVGDEALRFVEDGVLDAAAPSRSATRWFNAEIVSFVFLVSFSIS